MRAIVVGGSGFVGRFLLACLGPRRGLGTWHSHELPDAVPFDATRERFRDLLARLPGDFTHAVFLHGIIDVERCALDPAGTAQVNVDGLGKMIDDALDAGLIPVFTSSDYVFDGARGGYTETDEPTPCTEYGRQKLAIERRLAAISEPWLAIRLSRVVGTARGTHSVLGPWINELRAGKPMRVAVDQRFSPADVRDVAGALSQLLETGATGLYNLAGPEVFSRMGLLQLLLMHLRRADTARLAEPEPCGLHELLFRERRPLDTSLVIDKLQARCAWAFRPMDAVCAEAVRMAAA
jgi:dTDP-4-dehydrorhamnose reductase